MRDPIVNDHLQSNSKNLSIPLSPNVIAKHHNNRNVMHNSAVRSHDDIYIASVRWTSHRRSARAMVSFVTLLQIITALLN